MKSSLGKFLVLVFAFLPVFVSGEAILDGSAFRVKYGDDEKIDKYSICSIVHNRASGTNFDQGISWLVPYDLFVPAATLQEWRSFVDTYRSFRLETTPDRILSFEKPTDDSPEKYNCDGSNICLSDCPIKSILNDTGVTSALSVQTFKDGRQPIKTLSSGCGGGTYSYDGQDCDYGLDKKSGGDGDGKAGFSFTRLDENGNNYRGSGDYDKEPWACVRDNNTGLVWEVQVNKNLVQYEMAVYNARDIEKCGYRDWRVPHITEVVGLFNFGRKSGEPAIDTDYFPTNYSYQAEWWASTKSAVPVDKDRPFRYTYYGEIDYTWLFKDETPLNYVRLVRGYARNGIGDGLGDMPPSRFDYGGRESFSSTVTDTYTGLMWQRCSVGQTWLINQCNGTPREFEGYDDWGRALKEAEGSSFARYTDWRVPNVKELLSIVNYKNFNPAISTDVFPNTPKGTLNNDILYWTSTPRDKESIYIVSFNNGKFTAYEYDSNYLPRYVRLVRDISSN